jgi:hypothetical protein
MPSDQLPSVFPDCLIKNAIAFIHDNTYTARITAKWLIIIRRSPDESAYGALASNETLHSGKRLAVATASMPHTDPAATPSAPISKAAGFVFCGHDSLVCDALKNLGVEMHGRVRLPDDTKSNGATECNGYPLSPSRRPVGIERPQAFLVLNEHREADARSMSVCIPALRCAKHKVCMFRFEWRHICFLCLPSPRVGTFPVAPFRPSEAT